MPTKRPSRNEINGGVTWGHGVSAVALFLTQPRTMINMGVVVGVGVGGGGSRLLDLSDDDDADGLPRTKKSGAPKHPAPWTMRR